MNKVNQAQAAARRAQAARRAFKAKQYELKLNTLIKKMVAEHQALNRRYNLQVLRNTAKTLISKGLA